MRFICVVWMRVRVWRLLLNRASKLQTIQDTNMTVFAENKQGKADLCASGGGVDGFGVKLRICILLIPSF